MGLLAFLVVVDSAASRAGWNFAAKRAGAQASDLFGRVQRWRSRQMCRSRYGCCYTCLLVRVVEAAFVVAGVAALVFA